MRILATSREYVRIPIDPPEGVPDVTVYPRSRADRGRRDEPIEEDWQSATWIKGEAALLIGPGTPLADVYKPGDYYAFARVTAGAERVVLPSGRVRIGM